MITRSFGLYLKDKAFWDTIPESRPSRSKFIWDTIQQELKISVGTLNDCDMASFRTVGTGPLTQLTLSQIVDKSTVFSSLRGNETELSVLLHIRSKCFKITIVPQLKTISILEICS